MLFLCYCSNLSWNTTDDSLRQVSVIPCLRGVLVASRSACGLCLISSCLANLAFL